MGFNIGDVLTGGASGAIGAGMGLLLQGHNNDVQAKQQQKLTDIQTKAQEELTNYNYGKQLDMWKATNYGPQMEQLKSAGLNPGLMYGMGGGGGQSNNVATGSVGGGSAGQNTGEVQQGMALSMQAAQLALLNAQKKNIDADTANKESGVDVNKARVPNINENTSLQAQQSATEAAKAGQAQTEDEIKRDTKYDVKTSTAAKALSDAEALDQLYRQGHIQESSYNDTLKQIAANAAGQELKNKMTEEQINQIKEGIKQGWTDLQIKQQLATGQLENKDQDQIIEVIRTILHSVTHGLIGGRR